METFLTPATSTIYQNHGNPNKKEEVIFIVDDDPMYLEALEYQLKHLQKYDIYSFKTGEICLENMWHNPKIVVLDYYLNSDNPTAIDGIEVLKKIKSEYPETEVIMLSSQDNMEVAINTIDEGAYDYVTKGESAFIRIRNIVENITAGIELNESLQKGTLLYKRVTITVIILFVLFFILSRIL